MMNKYVINYNTIETITNLSAGNCFILKLKRMLLIKKPVHYMHRLAISKK